MFVSHLRLSSSLKFQNSHLPHQTHASSSYAMKIPSLKSGSCYSAFQLFTQRALTSQFAYSDQILALWRSAFSVTLVLPANSAPVNQKSDSNGQGSYTWGSRAPVYSSCLSAENSKPKERTEEETAFGITFSQQIPTLCTNLLYSLKNVFQEP